MKRLVQPGSVRWVATQILVDGDKMGGVKSLSVVSNSNFQADTWSAVFALNAADGQSLDWWGEDDRYGQIFSLQVTLGATAGVDGPWTTLLAGEADKISVSPIAGEVRVSGRDLTRRFIDARTQESFQNNTASEIVTLLAARRDMKADVTDTATLVSRYYVQDHDRVTHGQLGRVTTEWDLLHNLAQQEGFDLYVTGRTVHFHPTNDPAKSEPFVVSWDQAVLGGDIEDISLDRSLTLAKDVIVVVKSWSSRHGRGFTRTSPAGAKPAREGTKLGQQYVFTRPNLTEDRAQKLADSLREDITRHERTGSLTIPVELALSPRGMIQIEGVAGGWGGPFYVALIERSFSLSGATETIQFKNHSPESESVLG